jgi:phospholipid/cholesterol/gamma-HCH transport system substrate-binding protein
MTREPRLTCGRFGSQGAEEQVKRSVLETLIGAAVLAVAALFLIYAFRNVDAGTPSGYELLARFDRIDGLKKGSDVTVSGVKVGTVVDWQLDPKTFQAVVRLSVDSRYKLPRDTSAKLISESLLGGLTMSLEPGGDDKNLEPGGTITKTQGSINLLDLIGAAMFNSTRSDPPKNGSSPSPAPGAPPSINAPAPGGTDQPKQ